jgi:transcriptional regulator with XRE-family HTH domain
MKTIIYANIKRFRELKGITREFMAAELEISSSGYSKIERGETDVSLNRLLQIASLLNINVIQLLDFDAFQALTKNISSDSKDPSLQKMQVNTSQDLDNRHIQDKYIAFLEKENERLNSILYRFLTNSNYK